MTSTRTPRAEPSAASQVSSEVPDPDQLPHLHFDNQSELEALHFDTLDQHGTLFHVVVAKARYTIGARDAQGRAALTLATEPVTLNDDDLPYDPEDPNSSIREENDLAPYKPACDVLVTGQAYAPGGQPAETFKLRLQVREPDGQPVLPPQPRGLNPLQPASPQAMAAWRAEVQRRQAAPHPGKVLVDKTLLVYGPREWIPALLPSTTRLLTLGAVRPSPWQLGAPQPVQRVPLRYELAFGGECRIDADDEAAARVPQRHRLTAQQLAGHPDAQAPEAKRPVAHEASMSNPVGRGFVREWYLDAKRVKRLAAHQFELAGHPVQASDFWRVARGGEAPLPAGFGPLGRPWQPRLRWVGTHPPSQAKIDAGFALNEDFDYRYWNGAPADQQCRHLGGGEIVELMNLVAPDHPGAQADKSGNTVLRFEVPQRGLVLLGLDEATKLSVHDPVIDTVLIDTDRGSVDICWRWCIHQDQGVQQARLIEAKTPGQRERLEQLRRATEHAAAEPSPDLTTQT